MTRLLLTLLLFATPALASDLRVLGGCEASTRYGERGVGAMGVVDAAAGPWWAEAQASTLDKYTSAGWRASVSAGVTTGVLLAGLGYSHRSGGEWAKDILWARVGATHGPLTVMAQIAPESKNREVMVEVRARGQLGRVVAEARGWVGDHVQAEGGYAYGVQMLVGWAKRR